MTAGESWSVRTPLWLVAPCRCRAGGVGLRPKTNVLTALLLVTSCLPAWPQQRRHRAYFASGMSRLRGEADSSVAGHRLAVDRVGDQ
jgi:hypothetical protein